MEEELRTYVHMAISSMDNIGNDYEFNFEFKCNPELTEELRLNLLNACLVQVVTYSKASLDGGANKMDFYDPFFDHTDDHFESIELKCKHKETRDHGIT